MNMEVILLLEFIIFFFSKVDINSNSNIIENVFIFKSYTKEEEVFFRKEYNYTVIIFHLKNEYIY